MYVNKMFEMCSPEVREGLTFREGMGKLVTDRKLTLYLLNVLSPVKIDKFYLI